MSVSAEVTDDSKMPVTGLLVVRYSFRVMKIVDPLVACLDGWMRFQHGHEGVLRITCNEKSIVSGYQGSQIGEGSKG